MVPKITEVLDDADAANLIGPNLASALHVLVRLRLLDSHSCKHLFPQLRKGRSDARNADVSTVKNGLFKWPAGIDWNPPAPETRQNSGHSHPVCSRLLCPPNFSDADMRYVHTI